MSRPVSAQGATRPAVSCPPRLTRRCLYAPVHTSPCSAAPPPQPAPLCKGLLRPEPDPRRAAGPPRGSGVAGRGDPGSGGRGGAGGFAQPIPAALSLACRGRGGVSRWGAPQFFPPVPSGEPQAGGVCPSYGFCGHGASPCPRQVIGTSGADTAPPPHLPPRYSPAS